MKNIVLYAVPAMALASAVMGAAYLFNERPLNSLPRKVSYLSFPREFVILGKLNLPLGMLAKVRGVWRIGDNNYKTDSFEITSINDETLSKPLVIPTFSIEDSRPPSRSRGRINGEQLEALVYEGGAFHGLPYRPENKLLDIPENSKFAFRPTLNIHWSEPEE
jgi:hypothetical protein